MDPLVEDNPLTLEVDEKSPLAPGLRILLMVEAANAGAGKHVCDLFEGLVARGHQVRLLYAPDRADQNFRDRLSKFPPESVWSVPMRRTPGLWDLAAWRKIRSLIRRDGLFDVVHGHSAKAGALTRLMPRSLAKVRLYTPHAFPTLDPGLSRFRWRAYAGLERVLARFGDGVIAVCEYERRHATDVLALPEPLFVVFNGVSTSSHTARRKNTNASANDGITIGFVGRYVWQKGPEFAVEAFAQSAAGRPDDRLVMIGDGPMRVACEQRAQALGISDQVQWDQSDSASRWLPRFDVLIAPSRYESFPYLILEAMSAGVPVVASRVGGVPEQVLNDQTGLLVEAESASALAEGIKRMVTNPQLRAGMSEQSVLRAEFFGLNQMVEQTIAVYAKCLQKAVGS